MSEETAINSIKRCRRRTTVFNEVQLRTLYLHFTYCNFPDPSMFKIIGSLTKLEPQVIKIWFQNERSRQRKRAAHFLDEGKCCGDLWCEGVTVLSCLVLSCLGCLSLCMCVCVCVCTCCPVVVVVFTEVIPPCSELQGEAIQVP